MSEQPPPYRPFFPEGPPSSMFPSAFSLPPAIFPGSAYQTFPQTLPGDQTFYQPGPAGQHGASVMPSGYHGDQHGDKHQPKHPVYMVEQRHNQGGGIGSYLAACSAALCCCCLWDLLHR